MTSVVFWIFLLIMESYAPTLPTLQPDKIYFGESNEEQQWSSISLSSSQNQTSEKILKQRFIFPTQSDRKRNVSRFDSLQKCPDGDTLCENADDYPHEYVKGILRKMKYPTDLFVVDEPLEIGNRYDINDERYVCASVTKTIFPKFGLNRHNEWRPIINQNDDRRFVQGIRTESCANTDTQCDFPGNLIIGYQTYCKQQYAYGRLISLNDDGQPVIDSFKIPSACCCAYKSTDTEMVISRFGKDTDNNDDTVNSDSRSRKKNKHERQ